MALEKNNASNIKKSVAAFGHTTSKDEFRSKGSNKQRIIQTYDGGADHVEI